MYRIATKYFFLDYICRIANLKIYKKYFSVIRYLPKKFFEANFSSSRSLEVKKSLLFRNSKPISHLLTSCRFSKAAGESVALPKCWAYTHISFVAGLWPATGRTWAPVWPGRSGDSSAQVYDVERTRRRRYVSSKTRLIWQHFMKKAKFFRIIAWQF